MFQNFAFLSVSNSHSSLKFSNGFLKKNFKIFSISLKIRKVMKRILFWYLADTMSLQFHILFIS